MYVDKRADDNDQEHGDRRSRRNTGCLQHHSLSWRWNKQANVNNTFTIAHLNQYILVLYSYLDFPQKSFCKRFQQID